MSSFRPLKGDCPICNGAGKRCTQSQTYDRTKYTTGLVFCASYTANNPDWHFLHPDPHTGFHIWAYRNGRITTDPITSENFRKQQERERQARIHRQQEKIKNSLSPQERDREIRKLLSCLTLRDHHRELLRSRGLTDKQIAKNGYRSVRKWQKLSTYINPNLGGINRKGRGLNNFNSGILCPVINEDGLYVGLRINHLSPKDGEGKYVWISSSERGVDNKIPVSNTEEENPIAVHFPDKAEERRSRGAGENCLLSTEQLPSAPLHPCTPAQKAPPPPKRIGICEGLEYKAAIAANKLGFPVIGIGGCNFHKSPELLKRAIAKINRHAEIVIIPDAGANPFVAGSYARALQAFGYLREWENAEPVKFKLPNLKIAWWEQYGKHHGDIDEISDDVSIKGLIPEEFPEILKRLLDPRTQKWIASRKFTPDLVINQRYFTAEVPAENIIYCIKSGLGTGKTFQLIKWVKELEKKLGFISLGCRNSLLKQFCHKALFYHIHEKDARTMAADELSQLALCVDSILKLTLEHLDNKVIILDETVSVIYHLIKSTTINNLRRESIVKHFREAINQANRVICLDGNFTDYIADFLSEICPDKKVIKVFNRYQEEREIYFYKGSITKKGKLNTRDKSAFLNEVYSARRPAIVSDSQKFCEQVDEVLSTQDYKTLRADRFTTPEEGVQQFLANPDQYIEENKPDSIVMSPSVESGVSIDTQNYFSDVFIAAHGVQDVNRVRQHSQRIRDKNVKLHLWANSSVKVKNLKELVKEQAEQIKDYVENKIKLGAELSSDLWHEAIESLIKEGKDDIYANLVSQMNAIEQYEKDANNYYWCLAYAFREDGFEVIEVEANSNLKADKKHQEAKEVVNLRRATNIFNAPDLTEEQLKYSNDSQDNYFAIQKALIKKQLPGIEETDTWSPEFINEIKNNHPSFIQELDNYFKYRYPNLIEAMKDKNYRFFVDLILDEKDLSLIDFKDHNRVVEALQKLDLDEILNKPEKQWRWCSPEIQRIFKKLKRSPKIRETLGIKQCKESYAIREINRALSHIGKVLKGRKVGWDGQTIRVYKLHNKHQGLIDKYPHCQDAIENRWKTWCDREMTKLEEKLDGMSENPPLSKIPELLALHSLSHLALTQQVLNNTIATSDCDRQKLVKSKLTRGRLDVLIQKLTRKTFIEGRKIQKDEKVLRNWLKCAGQEALKEIISFVEHGWQSFETSMETFGTAIQFEVMGVLKRWLPE